MSACAAAASVFSPMQGFWQFPQAGAEVANASQVMSYGWFGGHTFPWVQIVAMIAWAAVFTPLAVKLFRWR